MVPANHFPNMHDIPEEIAEEGKKDENDAQNEEENRNVVVVPAPNIIAEGEMTVQQIGGMNQGIVVEVTEPVNVGAALNVSLDGDSKIAGYKGKSITDICTCPFHYHPLRRGYEEMKAGGDGMPYNPSPGVKKPNAKAPSPDVGVQLYAEKISEAPVQVEEGEEEDIDAGDDNEVIQNFSLLRDGSHGVDPIRNTGGRAAVAGGRKFPFPVCI